MLIRELIDRYVGPGGSPYARGSDLPSAEISVGSALRELDRAVELKATDLVIIRVADNPELRPDLLAGLPADLPLGVHVIVLLDVEARLVQVSRVVAALADAGLQVVAAFPLSSFAYACTAVVASRSDELLAPEPLLADAVAAGELSGTERSRRLLGEQVLDRLVHPARVQALADEAAELQLSYADASARLEKAEPDAAAYATVAPELERTKARLAQIEQSETWRVAQVLARGLARAKHPTKSQHVPPQATLPS